VVLAGETAVDCPCRSTRDADKGQSGRETDVGGGIEEINGFVDRVSLAGDSL
jgi:hypothetical protein